MTDDVNVPRDPTPEMWSAGERAFDRDPDMHHETVLANVWTAMIATAPKAEPIAPASDELPDELDLFRIIRDAGRTDAEKARAVHQAIAKHKGPQS